MDASGQEKLDNRAFIQSCAKMKFFAEIKFRPCNLFNDVMHDGLEFS